MNPEENGCCESYPLNVGDTVRSNRERGLDLNALQTLIQGLPNQSDIRAINFDSYGITIQYNHNAIH